MKANNAKKHAQLGMPYGTACNRLRKSIILNLLQQLGQDTCFKCGERIETVETLSIEHKIPWQDNDTALFWDLNNIAFSHLSCNRSRQHHDTHVKRMNAPSGQTWCTHCQSYKSIELFYMRKGKAGYCKECRKKITREYKRKQNQGMKRDDSQLSSLFSEEIS
jgi:hypothetical protein